MFVGSFCICSEGDKLNYEEFELTEFMTDAELETWKAKAIEQEGEANQVVPMDDAKGENKSIQ